MTPLSLLINYGELTLDSCSATSKIYTVEEVVDNIGFGRYQVLLLLVAGFSWVSMEILHRRNEKIV